MLLLYVFCSLFSILQMLVETKLRNLRNHLDSTHLQLAKLLNLHLARKTQTKMRKVRNLLQKNLQKRNHLQLKHQGSSKHVEKEDATESAPSSATAAADGSSIVVQSGEGAGSIAARAGISVDELERLTLIT